MGKGRPRAVEKGVVGASNTVTCCGSTSVPSAPVYYPTEDEFKDPLDYIYKIRPEAEPYGICRIVPPKGWNPPFALDLDTFTFPTKTQAIHKLQARPAASDPKTFDLEYTRFLQDHCGKKSRKRVVFEGEDLDLCKLFNAVKRFGGYDKVVDAKKWGDVARFLRPAGKITDCAKHVLCQLYREHLYDYEEFYNKMNQGNAKNCNKGERDERKSDHRVQSSMSKKHPCKVSGLKVKDCKVHVEEEHDQICEQCKSGLHGEVMLLCDRCDKGWHIYCLSPPLKEIPQGNWYCFSCLNSDRDSFGFVPGKHYTLEAFRRIADRSRRRWFGSGPVSRVQMEKKFWEIVEGSVGEVEVMYGNDLDTSVYGSGFPRVADQKMQSVDDKLWQEYATSPWNLNNLPKLKGSMLRSIQHNITGVMVPWLYIGMLFSSFCWHFEDHCFYSMNYLHWGEPKCWYSVPGSQASAFEKVMRSSLPDLFDVQPDLLFQLVTMLNPSVLQDNGVPVYSVLQEPGNFVITFPRSYHGGFNLGLNCAEAVNFAPADWLPFGAFGADLYQRYHKPAVLSHEELLCVVAQYGDVDSRVSSYLKKELLRISDKEKSWREKLWKDGIIKFSRMTPRKCPQYVGTEEDPTCIICQQYLYLSAVVCSCRPSSFVCLEHWEHLCECKTVKLRLLYRHSLAELFELAFSVDEFTSDDKAECRSVRRQSSCPGALTKKVKGSCVTFDQLATEWLLQASMILQNPFLSNVFVTTLRKAEQFLWAGSEMDSVRDMAKTLVEAQKWAEGIRDCVTKVESWYQDSNVKKVHLEFIDELLRFNPPPCNEPNYPKLKEYAEEARLLVQEIDTALSACSKMSELELLYSRACGLPIYMKVIKKLERRISSTKTWLDSVRKCISERHPTVLEVGILYNLNSEISDLRVHLPEKEVLENLLSQAESCSVQCREMLEGPMNLENVSLLLKEWDNFTVAVPELQLLRQYHSDTVLWLARVNDILGRAPVQGDQHNTVNELMCIFEEGSSLKIQVDELPLVELELKKASCREKALKACDSRMPLEFIQQLLEEATMLHIEEEKLFINLSCVLALAIPWEERAREMLSHENPISDFEDMIRDSENIFAILPSLNDVKDALSEANLWLRNSKPYLVSSARASNSLLKVEDLQMLVSESKLLKISLGERKMLELVLKNCKLWECEASSLLDDCQCLFELDNSVDGISSDLMFRVEDLIARIQSAIASGVSLGFDFIEISKLQASCSTLHWCKRALCFRDCPPSLEDVLEVVEGLSHSSVSGVLLKVLVDGVEWLRRALEGMSRPCNSRRCHLTEVQDTLNDYKNVKMTFGAVYCQLEEAIRKHIIMSSSSSPVNYDNRRFLSEFNQTMYEAYATKKDIIYERSFELDEDEYSEIQTQITLRGWKKLVNPVSKMKSLMVKEFYANAARTQDEMDATEQHPFSSFVRGKKIIFSPANIKRVMKIKDSTPGAETDYDTRQHSNPLLDEVIRDLCVPGATWRYGVTQPPQPIQLRRRELKPLARGWQEFIINNVHPSSNKSEISVPIAILIHCIMKGEDVRIEELISARIALTAQNFNNKNRLGFPSLIYKLCKDAEVPFKEFKRTPYITIGNPITARVMETTRGGALPTLRRHEEAEYESHDQEMHENTPEQNYEEENDDWVENFANHDTYYEQEQHYEQPYYEQQQYQQPPHQQAISFADFQSFQEQLREQQQQHHKSMSDMMNNMHIETLNYFEEMKAQHDNYIENLKSVKTQQETYFEELKTLSEQQEEFRTEQNRQLNIIRQRQDTMAKEISEMKKAQENATAMFVINRKQKEKSNDYPDRCGH